MTILGKAAMYGPVAVLQLFLDMEGLDIDHQDETGNIALHWCNSETLPLLIECGANISLKNTDGYDAFDNRKRWFASGLVMINQSDNRRNEELAT